MKRLSISILIVCACFVPVASGQQPAGKCYNSWGEFHRYNMWRWNRCEKVLGVKDVGKLSLKWSYATGYLVDPSPAVADGVVYVGSNDGNVFALKANTGRRLWSYPTRAAVASSPAVADGVVYVGSDDNNLYALRADTGTLLWSYATGNYVYSSPAVADGVVYVGSNDGNVYALNAHTGALLWSYTTGNQAQSSPAVVNGVVYVGSNDGNVYALNASTGALLWSYTTGGGVFSSPAVANGVVYVGSDGQQRVRAERQAPAPSCGATPLATLYIPRPPWPMEWFTSVRWTATCTR